MGLFKQESFVCAVCGTYYLQTYFRRRIKIKDATVCSGCILRAGYSNVWGASKLTLDEIRPKAQVALKRMKNRQEMPVDIKMGDDDCLRVDTTNRRWYCLSLKIAETNEKDADTWDVYSLDDVRVTCIERYVVEDVNLKTTSDGTKRAIVGRLLAGTTGAVIGAAGANQTTTGTSVSHTHFRVHLRFLRPAELAGKEYWLHLGNERELQQFLRWFKQEGEEEGNENQPAIPEEQDIAAGLRRLKALLNEGLITQQDFDAKKKQLLGL